MLKNRLDLFTTVNRGVQSRKRASFGAVLRVVLKVVLEVDFGTLRRPLSATQTEFQFLATRRISTQHLSLREQYV